MINKDDGVVLKTARSGETTRIVTFLGRHSGKVRLVAKGALKPTSPFRGALEPGNHAEVLYYFKEGRTRYYLREIHVHSSIETGRDSLARMASALAVIELVEGICFWESPDERVVDLVIEYLRCPPAEDPLFLFLVFETRLLAVLGALPEFSSCAACGETFDRGFFHPEEGECACPLHARTSGQRIELGEDLVALSRALAGDPLERAARTAVEADLRKRLGTVLHWTYTFHVQNYRLPESLKLLQKD